jgi:translation initiation factor 2 subunit 1
LGICIGYIDLSKRRVSAEDVGKCEERYNKGKMVASIMRHVAEKTKTPMEELYSHIGWPLNKKYGNALDAFKMSITYVSLIFSFPQSTGCEKEKERKRIVLK